MTSLAVQTMPIPTDAELDAPAVCARSLTKVIDERLILSDISFELPQGRYVALLGANGAGKSTLLRLLSTLTSPTSGRLDLFGLPVRRAAEVRSRLGMIGHGLMLYRELSPLENLALFGRLYGVKDPRERACDLLDYVGLSRRKNDPVKTFSRGMAQRVAIARALMHDPDLILADEPFAGLDAPSRLLIENLLARLHGDGKTVLLANHDIGQSLALAQDALVLRRGRLVLSEPCSSLSHDDVLSEVSVA